MTEKEIIKKLSEIIPTSKKIVQSRYTITDNYFYELVTCSAQSLINALIDDISRDIIE